MRREMDSEIPPEVRSALWMLRREAGQTHRRLFFAVVCWSGGLAAFLNAIGRMQGNTTLGLFLLVASVLLLIGGILLLPRPRSRALATLAEWRDVRAIGPLLEFLPISVGHDRPQVVLLLTDLLSVLREEDAPRFTRPQRRRLMDALHFSEGHHEVYFQVAIVHALARIGDAEALPLLKTLARDGEVSDYEHIVRDAAREQLPVLLDRIARLRQSENLLRPAGTEGAEEGLLRPATGEEETDPETLLRPT